MVKFYIRRSAGLKRVVKKACFWSKKDVKKSKNSTTNNSKNAKNRVFHVFLSQFYIRISAKMMFYNVKFDVFLRQF